MGIVLTIFGIGLTAASPVLSLMLFVALSPFGVISDFTGIDPRTYWALALGVRVAFHQLRYKARIPIGAQVVWGLFTLTAAVVLWTRGANLESAEFEKARYLLQYFIAGSLVAAALIELPRAWRDRRRIAYAFTVAVAWACGAAIIQGVYLWYSGSPGRVTGTLGNANYMATFLAASATALLLLQARGWVDKRHAYPVIVLACLACGFTMSRTGLLAVTLGLLLHRACNSTNPRRWRQFVVTGVVVGAVFGGLALYVTKVRPQITYSGDARGERLGQLSQAISDLSRLHSLLFSVKLIQDSPVLGTGFGTFPARNYDANGVYLNTHDTYLELLTGTGIRGALLFGVLIRALVRAIPRSQRRWLLPWAVCLGVNAAFGDYLQSIEIFVVFAISYAAVLYAPDAPANTASAGSLSH